MNWLQKLFTKKSNGIQPDVSGSCKHISAYEAHEILFVQKVICLLKDKPDEWSARWFMGGSSLQKSVRWKYEILIMIETGEILQPINPKLNKAQKELLIELIKPIVERDSLRLLEKYVCNCH